jgi:hypothetical protein
MDRVEPLDGSYPFRRSERKKSREKKDSPISRFPPLMESAHPEELTQEGSLQEPERGLVALLDGVHEEGERLKEAPTLENIRRYKQVVRGFLNLALKRMLTIDERTSGASIQKRKRFTQIRIIDQKLEKLVADVLRNQSRQLDILEKVDEIHGLLVDLLT